MRAPKIFSEFGEYIAGSLCLFAILISLWMKYIEKDATSLDPILQVLASVFGSLVGFSLAALGIVFAVIQRKEYDVLFKHHHAEVFFQVFKNNQIISFICFSISMVGFIKGVSGTEFFRALLISCLATWIVSFLRLVGFFNLLVKTEIKLRKKAVKNNTTP